MTSCFRPFSINLHGRAIEYTRPAVMGIVNFTPDSFYAGSRNSDKSEVHQRVEQFLSEGCDIIDVGAYSSRPGADEVSEKEELSRLATALAAVRDIAPDIPVSVDTFRASVAREAITNLGADIINDIGGGTLDPEMFCTVTDMQAPYILMHMRGTPATMQSMTDYEDVTVDVITDLSHKLAALEELGAKDVIVDPGLGFSKTVEQNYRLLSDIPHFINTLGRPVLIGLSRKSMLTRPLGISSDQALCATTSANTIALLGGASILRVHDVKEAVQARDIVTLLLNS